MPKLKENHPIEISSILLDHQKRYPLWQIKDVYKLLHQAAMGSEHAVQDEDGVRSWMERELKEMEEVPMTRSSIPFLRMATSFGCICVHWLPKATTLKNYWKPLFRLPGSIAAHGRDWLIFFALL